LTRVLVFLSAHANGHAPLRGVPHEIWKDPNLLFLYLGDASSHESDTLAKRWLEDHGITNAAILRREADQGYGGNRKFACRLALEADFAFVILLPPNSPSAIEHLPRLIETCRTTDADVVLGSPVQRPRTRATRLQNWLTKRGYLSLGSSYGCYAARFLRRVPFETNSNGRRFDTELLLQALYVGARVMGVENAWVEDEDVEQFGWMAVDACAATVRFKMHQMGMFCSLRYRSLTPGSYCDKTGLTYSSHRLAVDIVRRLAPRTVLDIGSGDGFVAKRCSELGAEVTQIDRREPSASTNGIFVEHDLERLELPEDASRFDVVLLLDVLEHLAAPEEFLIALRNRSTGRLPTTSRLLICTPNVAFAAVRASLLFGRFHYADRGILDVTHKRLFTRQTLVQCLTDSGYRVEETIAVGAPFEAIFPGLVGRGLSRASQALADLWPSLFAFQFMAICIPGPGLRQILGHGLLDRQATDILAYVATR
jgi:2-polyprenyl-3-methyl-5-hydroxy-6-metoxy-1,4-benzoquinol methylase